jgi:hypothetical protein
MVTRLLPLVSFPSDVCAVCAMHVHDANEDLTSISRISLGNNIELEESKEVYQQSLLIFGGIER